MFDTYHHGVRVLEVTTGTQVIRTVATAVIGLICTADDADEAAFPLNTPVLLTDLPAGIARAGVAGTLRRTLPIIDQIVSTFVVVVRVAEAADPTANVVGLPADANGLPTGLYALRSAESVVGYKPRILAAPWLDGQQAVATALVTTAQALRAFPYVSTGIAETPSAAAAYSNNFSARELMLLYPSVRWYDAHAATAINAAAPAFAVAMRAKVDQEQGWHRTISNLAIPNALGVSRPVTWDLMYPNTEAGLLNAGRVTTLVRREGVGAGIGTRFWGCRTTSSDSKFAFENATRSGQIIADTIGNGVLEFIDRPLNVNTVRDLIDSIDAKLRQWTSEQRLLGGRARYDADLNSTTQLSNGQLAIVYDYTPVPPLEQLALAQKITDTYLVNFAQLVDSRSQTLPVTPGQSNAES